MEIRRKSIAGYEGCYEIDTNGKIYSIDRVSLTSRGSRKIKGRILRPSIGTNGYKYVVLSREGKTKTHYSHKLVAEAFLFNPKGLSDVDHIDGNKLNNSLSNLQYLSHLENVRKSSNEVFRKASHKMEANPRARKVFFACDGEIIKIYSCAKQMALEQGLRYSTLKGRLQKIKDNTQGNLKYAYL